MTRRAPLALPAALLALALGACSKDSKNTTVDSVAITASRTSAYANGTNTVTLSVTASGAGVTVRTTRGTFTTGGTTAAVAGASGDVVLTTCNAATDTTCAGTARVTAIHGGASRTLDITFGGLELCTADCNADAACGTTGHSCTRTGGTGTCSGTPPSAACAAPSCTAIAASETVCSGGTDEDCNGAIDCADTACTGRPCKPGSPTFLCQGTGAAATCLDVSSGAGFALVAGRTRLPADGANTTPITATVTQGALAASGVSVTFSTTLGTFASTGTATATATTDASGKATVSFVASATAGTAAVHAAMTSLPQVSGDVQIAMPALGSISLASLQYPVQGVRDSGYREINAVTVALEDDQGNAYPDGLRVRFEHRQLGGSEISLPRTADTAGCVAAQNCIGYETVTDASGMAQVNLRSGSMAGTLVIDVSATGGGLPRSFTVPNVAVVGAKASGSNFSIVCSPRNVPALAETDCHVSLVGSRIDCQALLKDRFGNVLGTQTQVTFRSEAGAVGPPSTTPAFTPGSAQTDLGIAKQYILSLGAGLPVDVPAVAGEPSAVGTDGCGRTLHPRNGLVTVIAIADGEESFVDLNGNGVYDGPGSANLPAAWQAAGEPFIDLGEPFVDVDDDGVYTSNVDILIDVNGNNAYDGPNGVWDANTKLWTQTAVVYTTAAAALAGTGGNLLGMRWADFATFTNACTATAPPSAIAARQNTTQRYVAVASDQNLNRLAVSTAYAVAKVPGTATIDVTYGGLASYADGLGIAYRTFVCDRNGASCSDRCDPALVAPANIPCRMTPGIAGYDCGIAAGVTVLGPAAVPTASSNVSVEFNANTTHDRAVGSVTELVKTTVAGTVGP